MGSTMSVSRSYHHGVAHPQHSLQREVLKIAKATCGMCHLPVALNERVYRCVSSECKNFLLHDACFRLPKSIKHFTGRRLKLTNNDNGAGGVLGGYDGDPCSICRRSMAGVSCVYKSTNNHGGCLRVHPRCGALPQSVSTKHEHPVELRESTASNSRKCVNCGRRSGAGSGWGQDHQPQAWSYECSVNKQACHGVELCLKCALGNKPKCLSIDDDDDPVDIDIDDDVDDIFDDAVENCSTASYFVGRAVKQFILGLGLTAGLIKPAARCAPSSSWGCS
ncbi:hypothetical protein GUJ93_ZPchr0010g7203 [Zizania palustris]|uniref:DC1 domain-containing protein n=1 Tax=Zizania palustris TaxID=103762 RepID=A0A8J6BGW0_ZIZPA|nr:hypothetical protein GUJ93_ZPchr0010g7203 [Zizania palustris]